ncbi:MAG TPA: IPT/TIG domain-containing protein [Acidimicrobiales bacterium]|nr:IPT/TIG domain-containing protein [Acidimicrobiales bacterium]
MRQVRRAGLAAPERRAGSSTRARRKGRGDEVGAVLVLALVFLIIGAVVIGALANALTSDLRSSQVFQSARSEQYAARSATNLAINSIRYARCSPSAPGCNTNTLLSQTLNASPPGYCWGNGPKSEFTVDGVSMDVWCSTAWNPTSSASRVVTFSTCPDGESAALCAAQPFLQAVVTFDDYPSGVSAPSSEECYLYCGTGMITDSWTWSPTVPTVASISPASGSITGGTSVTITGTGFATITSTGSVPDVTSVNFVEESGGVPTSDNVVLSATNVAVNSSTSITALSPPMTEGSTYYVTVTTPTGTSAYCASGTNCTSNVFTNSPVAPTVTGISPATGTIAGGDAVTITGSGFFEGATVNFVQELNGTPVTGGSVLASPNVTVNGSTSITAVSPGVTGGSLCQGSTVNYCYFVTVTTSAGTSATSSNDVFSYTPLVPIASSISPTSGTSGTVVTILGTGFLTGAVVKFVPENNGTVITSDSILTVPQAQTTITSSSTITVPAPSGEVVTTYYVTVTTSAGTSQYLPIFTY